MQSFAAYVAAARHRKLSPSVTEAAKHHVLDTIAAMVSGTRLLPGRMAISYVKKLGGAREATIVGTKLMTSAANAALANGMLAHADETDDSHAPSFTHPGCGIVPAALAMAERGGRDGTALLRAVVLGYDVSARVSLALGAAEFRRVGHLTHCFGPLFGAATASASLARFASAQVRHVLSYAAQQACGISTYPRDPDHIEKAFEFGGMPARNGVTAALMVDAGFTGVDDVFSGERNFFVAFNESGRTGTPPRPDTLIQGLGKNYEITNTNIKRWSVGSPIQAPLDSLRELIRTANVRAEDVEKVTIRVSRVGAETTNNRNMPDICMQHLCAVMLLDGTVTFDAAHNTKLFKNNKILAIRRLIDLQGDDELQRLLPERHGIVEIRLKDGRILRHRTRAVRGTPRNPMTRDEVDEKCYHLMAPPLGTRRARALCDAVWNIDRYRDIRSLRPLLRA